MHCIAFLGTFIFKFNSKKNIFEINSFPLHEVNCFYVYILLFPTTLSHNKYINAYCIYSYI